MERTRLTRRRQGTIAGILLYGVCLLWACVQPSDGKMIRAFALVGLLPIVLLAVALAYYGNARAKWLASGILSACASLTAWAVVTF